MSCIYEAEDLLEPRVVAVKLLHPSLGADDEAALRLRREADLVALVQHRAICRVFGFGWTASGSPYLVMERLVGESLAARIARGPLAIAEAAAIVKQVLSGLEAAHAQHVLHRDLKPQNVFLVREQQGTSAIARILDFGISKSLTPYGFAESQRLTQTGVVMGTPYYMAPEQARGEVELDARVDLWAVGVMLYEVLAGRRPFVAANYNALLVKILTSRPRPVQELRPELPARLCQVVEKAMHKLREDRFQSAREFRAAMQWAEHGKPSGASSRARAVVEDADTVVEHTRQPGQAAPEAGGDALLADQPRTDAISEQERFGDDASYAPRARRAAAARPPPPVAGAAAELPEAEDTEVIIRPESDDG
ncbi:MAG: serine/threonine protein kinase [Deltaproteobacteria bacterium]|nr:serine/threonine protein kinase [Deltaproteobacteria bacterium]